ncbi:MAG: HIT domain-containing protein [Candidatus Nanoarchaeia archaeon]
MIPENQLKTIKDKIISLIDPNLPEQQKQAAIKQISAMTGEQLEEFIKQNNLTQKQGSPPQSPGSQESGSQPQGCIFCAISEGKTESYKIDENKNAMAVLELNPISKGHSLVIPKKHVSNSGDVPSQAFTLAKKISKKIKTKLKPENVQISNSNMMGHEIIQVIPIYGDESPEKERSQATPEDLQKLQKLLEKKPRKKTVRKPRTKVLKPEETKKLWLPKRIP